MSIKPLTWRNTGEDFVISTPLLYTLTDSPMFQKSRKTIGVDISNPASPLHEAYMQQYVYPDVERGKVGFGWDIMEITRPNKVIFRVLDNTTIFHYLNDVNVLEWVTPVAKMVDIGQIADLDVIIT